MTVARYDLSMLEAAQGGDEDALCALLTLVQPDIRRYAQRNCAVSADVNDAVQETLWLLYRRVGTIRALTSVSGWLLMVVRRECWRLAQRAMGRTVELDDAEALARLTYRPQPELRLDLARAIQSLPGHYREVVLLRDIEEQTIDEIAATLGKTRESVKSLLHRARAMLREYLLR